MPFLHFSCGLIDFFEYCKQYLKIFVYLCIAVSLRIIYYVTETLIHFAYGIKPTKDIRT